MQRDDHTDQKPGNPPEYGREHTKLDQRVLIATFVEWISIDQIAGPHARADEECRHQHDERHRLYAHGMIDRASRDDQGQDPEHRDQCRNTCDAPTTGI